MYELSLFALDVRLEEGVLPTALLPYIVQKVQILLDMHMHANGSTPVRSTPPTTRWTSYMLARHKYLAKPNVLSSSRRDLRDSCMPCSGSCTSVKDLKWTHRTGCEFCKEDVVHRQRSLVPIKVGSSVVRRLLVGGEVMNADDAKSADLVQVG
eukprot:1687139-Amphidinium_carterae.1